MATIINEKHRTLLLSIMKNKKLYFLFLFLSLLFSACNGEVEIEKWPEKVIIMIRAKESPLRRWLLIGAGLTNPL